LWTGTRFWKCSGDYFKLGQIIIDRIKNDLSQLPQKLSFSHSNWNYN